MFSRDIYINRRCSRSDVKVANGDYVATLFARVDMNDFAMNSTELVPLLVGISPLIDVFW